MQAEQDRGLVAGLSDLTDRALADRLRPSRASAATDAAAAPAGSSSASQPVPSKRPQRDAAKRGREAIAAVAAAINSPDPDAEAREVKRGRRGAQRSGEAAAPPDPATVEGGEAMDESAGAEAAAEAEGAAAAVPNPTAMEVVASPGGVAPPNDDPAGAEVEPPEEQEATDGVAGAASAAGGQASTASAAAAGGGGWTGGRRGPSRHWGGSRRKPIRAEWKGTLDEYLTRDSVVYDSARLQHVRLGLPGVDTARKTRLEWSLWLVSRDITSGSVGECVSFDDDLCL